MKKQIIISAVLGAAAAGSAQNQKPNVVLIVADDLGIGDLGCYGSEKIPTPNLDKLAAQGVRALDAHATAAVCTPSRFAMLTGRYYWSGWNGELLVKPEWPTLPSVLRNSGYATGYFGKWHLGWGENSPERKHRADIDWNQTLPAGVLESGFDFYFGTPFTHNEAPSVFVLNRKVVGIEKEDPLIIHAPDSKYIFGRSTGAKKAHEMRPENRIDLMVTKQAQSWIEKNSSQPFFINICFVAPHVPLSPGAEFKGKTDIGVYGDFVHQMDWCAGQILETLEQCGVAENTLVIFTSDNGGVIHRDVFNQNHRSNLRWLGQKTDAWEGGVRVPFIARWPGHISAGKTTPALISLSDLCKTIWAVAGVSAPADAAKDSLNQLPVLLNPDAVPVRDEMLYLGTVGLALRSGDWVYIPRQGSSGVTTDFNQKWALRLHEVEMTNSDYDAQSRLIAGAPDTQLYNLRNDPEQSRNVVREHPEKAAELAARYQELFKQLW